MHQATHNKQAGFVSLFTVLFFILFITVITIGFLRIMGLEQQQALDNDLTASAVSAAESGVEDGKRAILAYYTTSDAALKAALATALTSSQCDALTGSATIRNALKLDAAGNAIGNPSLNQFYTCLTVNLESPDYLNKMSAGKSDFIPLIATGGQFEQIKVSWHKISSSPADGDGIPAAYPPDALLRPLVNTTGNPTNSWTSRGYPAYLRVQLYGYPNNRPFNRADLDARSRTLTLVPAASTNGAAADATTPLIFDTNDPRGFDQAKTVLKQIKCIPSPATSIGSYACSATLELPTDPALRGPNNTYFMRVTPEYGQSNFRLSLVHSGLPVTMNGVQPIVDATGRSADVFRRLQVRVRINPAGNMPEYAVQSADTICKNMVVSDGSFYTANTCP